MRHIVSLSGGRDSSALAVYLASTQPDVPFEYVFADTQAELPETYAYLARLQAYLGRPIIVLRTASFDEMLAQHRILPGPRARWCTVDLKIRPFERFLGREPCRLYIALRSDESGRKGFVSRRANVEPVYPFIEAGVDLAGVERILDEAGLGLPTFYEWRSRSGCYFCFFQRKREWLALAERYPELFERACTYESERYTWRRDGSLRELIQSSRAPANQLPLFDIEDDWDCLVCHR